MRCVMLYMPEVVQVKFAARKRKPEKPRRPIKGCTGQPRRNCKPNMFDKLKHFRLGGRFANGWVAVVVPEEFVEMLVIVDMLRPRNECRV